MLAAGGVPRLIPSTADKRFQLSAQDVAQHWTPATQGVLVASPSNPTGTSIAHGELAELLAQVRPRRLRHRRRDLPGAVRRPAALGADAGRRRHRHQQLLQVLPHDRLAPGLDDRARRHGGGGREDRLQPGHLRAHAGPARRAGLLHRRRAQDLRPPPRSLQAAPRLPAARIRAPGTARAGQAGRRLLYLRRHQRPGHGQRRFRNACCWKRASRPCRAWTSVRPTATTPCASPMPPAWTAWKRPSIAWASCWVTEPAFGFHEATRPSGRVFLWPGRDRIGINPWPARCPMPAPGAGARPAPWRHNRCRRGRLRRHNRPVRHRPSRAG